MYSGEVFSFNLWSYDPIDVRAAVVFIPEGEEVVLPEAPELPGQEPEEPEQPEQPEEPGEDPEEPSENVLTLGDNTFEISDTYWGIDVTFTAPKAGTYVFTIVNAGPAIYVNDQVYKYDGAPFEVELAENEVVTINIYDWNTCTLNVAEKTVEVEPEQPEQPEPDGDMTFVFFAMVVLSMAGVVVLVSKKRSF